MSGLITILEMKHLTAEQEAHVLQRIADDLKPAIWEKLEASIDAAICQSLARATADHPGRLLSAKEIAPLLGVTSKNGGSVVLDWLRSRVISAAIDEPGYIRFDLTDVRHELSKRAVKKARSGFAGF